MKQEKAKKQKNFQKNQKLKQLLLEEKEIEEKPSWSYQKK